MTELTGFFQSELTDWCKERKLPGFRAKQIFKWIHQGVDFDGMTNLPLALREQLKAEAIAQPVRIIHERRSKIDDTVKFLFGLRDGNCVEGVLMHYHHGYTLCISTQVGCRMGCTFCASTLDGCIRSLTAAEMLGQIVCANGEDDKNVVPVATAAGLTKTMAPRDGKTTTETKILRKPSDVHDFYRNFVATLNGDATQLITHPQLMRVMLVMEAAFESDRTGLPVVFNDPGVIDPQ